METREEKLVDWADASVFRARQIKILTGTVSLSRDEEKSRASMSEENIRLEQIETRLSSIADQASNEHANDPWRIRAISFPRLQPGRLKLSMPKETFALLQSAWNLHPRTIEAFLSNNGIFTRFYCPSSDRTSLVLKVANSRSTGFDCVSVTCCPKSRTVYALYHHLEDEADVFATLLSQPEYCADPYFFVTALCRSHHQHIEMHRNTIDGAVQAMERRSGLGNPGRLQKGRRASMDFVPGLDDPKNAIQQMSYCQTDISIIGHVARCALECSAWLVEAIDRDLCNSQAEEDIKAIRSVVRDEAEYVRRRTVMLLSQVQQMSDRAQGQTNFVSTHYSLEWKAIIIALNQNHTIQTTSTDQLTTKIQILSTITQSDADYTAAIAVDGKRDGIAMKTISILGIVFLPGTFVATFLSMDMFNWDLSGGSGSGNPDDKTSSSSSSLSVSPSIWIYFAVALPLTVITMVVWLLWSRRETYVSSKRLLLHRNKETFRYKDGFAAVSQAQAQAQSDAVVMNGDKMV